MMISTSTSPSSSSSGKTVLSLVLVSSLLAFSQGFEGEGTFYGAGGSGERGACAHSPGFNGVGITVAMNAEQYNGGQACGKCIVARGSSAGPVGAGTTPILGPIFATVDNECPECRFGDVDFGLGGDGRWRINWDWVDCSEARRSGSHLPTNATMSAHAVVGTSKDGKRALRGAADQQQQPEEPTASYLPPGYMVTPDGIKLIADVVVASARQKAEQEAQALVGTAQDNKP